MGGASVPPFQFINKCMKKKRRYIIPYSYEHAPEKLLMLKLNTTDVRKAVMIAKCVFGEGVRTLCYEDVEIEE